MISSRNRNSWLNGRFDWILRVLFVKGCPHRAAAAAANTSQWLRLGMGLGPIFKRHNAFQWTLTLPLTLPFGVFIPLNFNFIKHEINGNCKFTMQLYLLETSQLWGISSFYKQDIPVRILVQINSFHLLHKPDDLFSSSFGRRMPAN